MPPTTPASPRPKPHQAAALRRYATSDWAFWAMEMRLGKSLTHLWWCRRRGPGPHLLVAPLCTFASWLRDLEKLGERPLILAQQPWAKDPLLLEQAVQQSWDEGVRFFLVNWEGLYEIGNKTPRGKPKAVPTAVALYPWFSVGLDESTKVKNPQALVTKVVLSHMGDAPNRACLSGLPAPETYMNLFNQMLFLQGRWLGIRNWWEAREKFCFKVGGWEWVPKKGAVPEIKQAWRRDAFIATRAALGLETKPIRTLRVCHLQEEARQIYDKIEKEWAWGDDWAKHRMQLSVWLAGIASGWPANREESWSHKTNLLAELLTGEDEPELAREQVVVWCGPFRREVSAIMSLLGLFGVKARALVGGMKLDERVGLERDFQMGKFRVLVGMAAAGRYGMDLSCASVQIRFSYLWGLETHQQSEERTESMHRKTPTLMMNLVTEDTVDEDVTEALADKRLNARTYTHLIYEKFLARVRRKKEAALATRH